MVAEATSEVMAEAEEAVEISKMIRNPANSLESSKRLNEDRMAHDFLTNHSLVSF